MARPKESRLPERKSPATAATVHGASGGTSLSRSRHLKSYSNPIRAATVLQTVFNDDGHFVGLEVAR